MGVSNQIPKELSTAHKSIDIRVAEIYIFLLPWKMIIQLSFLKTLFGACAANFDFILNMLGLFLMLLKSKGYFRIQRNKRAVLFHYFVTMVLIMNLSSITMSIILHEKLGTIAGEDTYRAVAGQIVYYFQYIFIILYNREVFRLIPKERIEKIINLTFIVLIPLGYLQILIIQYGGIFLKIYQSLDIFHVLWPAYDVNLNQRLSLTGGEPASAGGYICRWVIPFLFAKIIYYGGNYKTTLQIILWLPILYFTKSSTGYVLFSVCLVLFIWFHLCKKERRKKLFIYSMIIALFAIVFIPYYKPVANSYFIQRIRYILVERVADKTNQGTITRKIPLIINYKTFLEYPILGVGNGNQGYFYIKHFPTWGYQSFELDYLMNEAKTTLENGSLFFPGILSGYGLLGTILVLIYILKNKKLVDREKDELGMFYYMFLISGCVILVNGFSGEFAGKYDIWFLVSLPYLGTYHANEIIHKSRIKKQESEVIRLKE